MSNKLGKFVWSALFALLAMNVAQAVVISGTDSSRQDQVVKAGYIRLSNTGGLTAFAGGGQTSALLLPSAFNVVTTVGTAADSVLLPQCVTGVGGNTGGLSNTDGLQVIVVNAAAANAMAVFPQTGQSINALSANASLSVAANKTIAFTCAASGIWYSNLTA